MGKYKSQERYDASNTKQIRLKLNLKTDADILEFLDECLNKQGYIKELIRRDMDMPERYVVRDHEAGNEIERYTTQAEALECMRSFVRQDKRDGTYQCEFYEVYDEESSTIIDVSE